MHISHATTTFIEAVQEYSGRRLQHVDACQLLVEASEHHSLQQAMADLCFTAKFLHKTFGVMKRIGAEGEGYDTLAKEFEANTTKARMLVQSLIEKMDEEDGRGIAQTYLTATAQSFSVMMELMHDLSWVKNYTIDTRAKT
jgi:hypothetical protein